MAEKELHWTEHFLYEISIKKFPLYFESKILSINSGKSKISQVFGLNPKEFEKLLRITATMIKRYFKINPKTLEINYCSGLLGGSLNIIVPEHEGVPKNDQTAIDDNATIKNGTPNSPPPIE